MKKLLIYGCGGLGKEVLSMVKAINKKNNQWRFEGFIDDDESKEGILGGFDYLSQLNEKVYVVLALGNPQLKSALANKITSIEQVRFATLIHPKALLQSKKSITIGVGSIITAGSIMTTDIEIGKHVLVNLNTTIGHNTSIGNCCSIMPGVNIAGGVSIENNVFVGSGANILNRLYIGSDVKIGSGAVVTKDVPNEMTMVGVPAKPVK